jgi:hypothetical protein
MVKVTGPTGPQASQPATPAEAKPDAAAKTKGAPLPADDGMSRAATGLISYKSSPLVSGAMKIFSDGVVFPPNILDIKDPRNDPKYLRLLAAVLGLDELERHFYTLEGEEQEEYLEHKAEQRERKWAKVEREKEEKRKKKESAKEEESKDDEEE